VVVECISRMPTTARYNPHKPMGPPMNGIQLTRGW
jgi:hypothetical protein